MNATLVIRNGTIVTENDTFRGDVVVQGDTIAGIVGPQQAPDADAEIDASGLWVFPGFVDGHVHFRDPGFTHKGDFATESRAAIYGGVTTAIDGPNTGTVVRFPADVEEKKQIGEEKSYVDFGQIAALTEENIDSVEELADAGVVAVKVFLGYKYHLSGLALAPPADGLLVDALSKVTKSGLRLSVHAENGDIITHLRDRFRSEGRNHPLDHEASRPAYGEADAIDTIIRFCEATKTRLEIRHLSCREGLPIAKAAKERGVDLVLETCPHYLVLDRDDLLEQGPRAIINPPIRYGGHREALLDGIRAGIIDTIGSDHGPSAPEEKYRENLWDVAPGFASVELSVPLLLTLAADGYITLHDVVRLFSANTAKAWDLYPRKGALLPGSDADITICEIGSPWVISRDRLHSKHSDTPYEGRTVCAQVRHVVRGGNVLVQDGELNEDAPRGRMVRPLAHGTYAFDRLYGPRLARAEAQLAEAASRA